jgi:hypothetical protein
VLLKIVYLLVRRMLGLIVVLARGNRAAAAEMLVLRHENAALRRRVSRLVRAAQPLPPPRRPATEVAQQRC